MFSVNSIPTMINNQENFDALLARKPGEVINSTRKAFQDRDINSKPQPRRSPQPQLCNIKKVDTENESKTKSPIDHNLLEPDYNYSKHVEDNYYDILPKDSRLTMEDISNFLLDYAKPSIRKTNNKFEIFNFERVYPCQPLKREFDTFDYVKLEDIVFAELEEFHYDIQ